MEAYTRRMNADKRNDHLSSFQKNDYFELDRSNLIAYIYIYMYMTNVLLQWSLYVSNNPRPIYMRNNL